MMHRPYFFFHKSVVTHYDISSGNADILILVAPKGTNVISSRGADEESGECGGTAGSAQTRALFETNRN